MEQKEKGINYTQHWVVIQHEQQSQIPPLLLGVCEALAPAPIPVRRGVPGTIILELEPWDVLTVRASSATFFAVLEHLIEPQHATR